MATPEQTNAGFAALKQLEAKDVPSWEQEFLTDQTLMEVTTTVIDAAEAARKVGKSPFSAAFTALQVYRANRVPFFEQGAVNDNILHAIVAAVLAVVAL